MSVWQILFGFQGRIRRTTFWLASIGAGVALAILLPVLLMVAGMFGAGIGAASGGGQDQVGATAAGFMGGALLLWMIPYLVLSAWVGLALGVKRCHDRGYSGVMILIELIPFFGQLWALIDLGFIDGTPGPNPYGPSPKGVVAPPVLTTGFAA